MKLINARRLIMSRKEKSHLVSYLVSSWVTSRLARNEGLLTEGDEDLLPHRNTGGIVGVGAIAKMKLVMACA
eukprot:11206151-Lingulodinium_polyedra.AAC.1